LKTFTAADLHFVDELSSTNSLLREIWEKEPLLSEAYALASFNQTAGRGQQDNVWVSEAGKNIAYSVFLRPGHLSPASFFVLSQAISLALLKTLGEEIGLQAEIKWPNDIYVDDKKIAGILIEKQAAGNAIGFGRSQKAVYKNGMSLRVVYGDHQYGQVDISRQNM
jgi:BirA family biotin operon repressor/biotin-[acetyl-CoA-carboxylase] ligase